jgi:hypothetical protein
VFRGEPVHAGPKAPVQSPSAVVVHAPVSGSAQCGYALPTRRRVSSMRFRILPTASVHIGDRAPVDSIAHYRANRRLS